MNLQEYLNREDVENYDIDFLSSCDEYTVKEVINALRDSVKIDNTYDDITFGQLVVLENALKDKDAYERIICTLQAFYRPKTEKVFDNTCKELEEQNRALFEGLIFGVCMELFRRVFDCRKEFFFEKYNGVVYDKNAKGAEVDLSTMGLEYHFNNIFGWYERQRLISKEMQIPFQDVLDLNANECMVELAYQQMKYNIESRKNKAK
jgi:hypothetical protein